MAGAVQVRTGAVDAEVIGNLKRMAQQSGQLSVFRRLIDEFLEEAEQAVHGMESAMRELDYRQLQAHAHALKGSAAQIGASGLSRIARSVEEAAKRDDRGRAVEPLDGALEELDRVRHELIAARELAAEPAA